jgi:hypothetical protein
MSEGRTREDVASDVNPPPTYVSGCEYIEKRDLRADAVDNVSSALSLRVAVPRIALCLQLGSFWLWNRVKESARTRPENFRADVVQRIGIEVGGSRFLLVHRAEAETFGVTRALASPKGHNRYEQESKEEGFFHLRDSLCESTVVRTERYCQVATVSIWLAWLLDGFMAA